MDLKQNNLKNFSKNISYKIDENSFFVKIIPTIYSDFPDNEIVKFHCHFHDFGIISLMRATEYCNSTKDFEVFEISHIFNIPKTFQDILRIT